jgi:hypothetical protein
MLRQVQVFVKTLDKPRHQTGATCRELHSDRAASPIRAVPRGRRPARVAPVLRVDPDAGHNAPWIGVVVPVAEWGAVACAIGAIWLGTRSRQTGRASLAAIWAPRIGWLTLGLIANAAFVVFPALYRED